MVIYLNHKYTSIGVVNINFFPQRSNFGPRYSWICVPHLSLVLLAITYIITICDGVTYCKPTTFSNHNLTLPFQKKKLSTLFKSKSPPVYFEIIIIFVPMNKIKVPTIGGKGQVGQSYEEKEKILL